MYSRVSCLSQGKRRERGAREEQENRDTVKTGKDSCFLSLSLSVSLSPRVSPASLSSTPHSHTRSSTHCHWILKEKLEKERIFDGCCCSHDCPSAVALCVYDCRLPPVTTDDSSLLPFPLTHTQGTRIHNMVFSLTRTHTRSLAHPPLFNKRSSARVVGLAFSDPFKLEAVLSGGSSSSRQPVKAAKPVAAEAALQVEMRGGEESVTDWEPLLRLRVKRERNDHPTTSSRRHTH